MSDLKKGLKEIASGVIDLVFSYFGEPGDETDGFSDEESSGDGSCKDKTDESMEE